MNEQIDRMRHAATRSLMERSDVIIVSSVSCIYGIGSVETYSEMIIRIAKGDIIDEQRLKQNLVALQYQRNDQNFFRGVFSCPRRYNEIFPSHLEDRAWRMSFFGEELENIWEIDPLTGERVSELNEITVYPNSHYVTPRPTLIQATPLIRSELKVRVKEFESEGKLIEAQRLQERTTF